MEKINIICLNIKNFKTNSFFLNEQILNNSVDICFLSETWLMEEENYMIENQFGNNFFLLTQNEMSYARRTKGRPYGGKCWMINKKFTIGNCIFVNNDVSYIEISNTNKDTKLVIVGVHLPFDDNSTTRMSNYISNLEMIKSIVVQDLDIPIFIIGDFNTDLTMSKRYSKCLNQFIQENSLQCIEYDFPNISYTYRNGVYQNHIDHVIGNDIARKSTIKCKIIEDSRNMSDHNAIFTSIITNISKNSPSNGEAYKRFYRFPWNEEGFIENYQKILTNKLADFKYGLQDGMTNKDKADYIEGKFNEIRKLLLQAARLVDKKSQKQMNIKKYNFYQMQQAWTPELRNISSHLNFWYVLWLQSDKQDKQAHINYKHYKRKFRYVQKIIIERNNTKNILNLTKIYKTERNIFWKLVKRSKSKRNFKAINKNLSLSDFEKFYKDLFSHKGIEEKEIHKNIRGEVENYYERIVNNKFQIEIKNELIDKCCKKLKNNKAVGNDQISNEMLKHAKCEKLTNILRLLYCDIINEGVTLHNFNISIISPIEKKGTINKHPEDFRPISVSNIFSNIYEMILLDKMEHLFKFNNKQFGYKANTSCKHASFIINETLSYHKKGGSPCYVISLDMKKAFDRMWRDGLFKKLMNNIEQPIWRALYNYYSSSKGRVKINNELSEEFTIKEGVKQGGILSPYLFNYFMNELLNESDKSNIGATINNINVSLISYCDDLVILSPVVNHVIHILKLCEDYAEKWKLIFNVDKCNWFIHGNYLIDNPNFTLNKLKLNKTNSLIHLGMPIGNQSFVEIFLAKNLRK